MHPLKAWFIFASLLKQTYLQTMTFQILPFLQNMLNILGYPAVVVFVMIESIGIPFPGETMLLLASFYAAYDSHLNIIIVIACAAFGAIVGDNLGFQIGRTGGKALVEKYKDRVFFLRSGRLEKTEQFFAHHGNKTVFLGRFVAVLRAWAAFLAGVNRMPWHTFLVYNAAGGILWATVFGLFGYYAGRFFHDNFTELEHMASNISYVISGIIVLGAIIAFVIYRHHKKSASPKATK
jgi:membrane protein DedA with SNARE-associated domain